MGSCVAVCSKTTVSDKYIDSNQIAQINSVLADASNTFPNNNQYIKKLQRTSIEYTYSSNLHQTSKLINDATTFKNYQSLKSHSNLKNKQKKVEEKSINLKEQTFNSKRKRKKTIAEEKQVGLKDYLKKDNKAETHKVLPERRTFKELREKTMKPEKIDDISEDQEQSINEALSNNSSLRSVDEPIIETYQNRKSSEFNHDMIGKGETVQDNQMINSTLETQTSIELPPVKFFNGSVYQGEWFQGMKHGTGIIIWRDRVKYQGNWSYNKSHGKGKLIITDKQFYQGNWENDQRSGYGIYRSSFGSFYYGNWSEDIQNGDGKEEWQNGQKYEGNWLQGKKNGYGEIIFEDGSFYKGNFFNNQIHGSGTYHWINVKTYEGQWEHNKMCGNGVLKWENNSQYSGEFKNDKMHGKGEYIDEEGSKFVGTWENGKKHGLIEQFDQEGNVQFSDWYYGKRICFLDEAQKEKMKRKKVNTSSETSSFDRTIKLKLYS